MTRKKKITLTDGSKVESLVEFDEGDSHIIQDGLCYVLVIRDEEEDDRFVASPRLFPEALEQLRKLPVPKAFFTKAVQDRLDEEAVRKMTRGR